MGTESDAKPWIKIPRTRSARAAYYIGLGLFAFLISDVGRHPWAVHPLWRTSPLGEWQGELREPFGKTHALAIRAQFDWLPSKPLNRKAPIEGVARVCNAA